MLRGKRILCSCKMPSCFVNSLFLLLGTKSSIFTLDDESERNSAHCHIESLRESFPHTLFEKHGGPAPPKSRPRTNAPKPQQHFRCTKIQDLARGERIVLIQHLFLVLVSVLLCWFLRLCSSFIQSTPFLSSCVR